MASSLVFFFWLSLCIRWPQCNGLTCSGRTPDSSCRHSKPCRADHPNEDLECAPNAHVPFAYPSSLPFGVSRCPWRNGEVGRCQPLVKDVNETLLFDSLIASAAVELKAIDYIRFGMNVSWSHSFNPTGGYEIRVKDNYDYLIDCYCLNDSDVRNLFLDDSMAYPPYTYHEGESTVLIQVLPLHNSSHHSLAAEVTTSWPASCLDIVHTSDTCALPIYHSPMDVTVRKRRLRSNLTQERLDITWHYQTSYTLPTAYYVEIYNTEDIFEFYTFMVNSTNSIEVKHLPASTQYSIRVQPYLHCSGLANRTYSLGCGIWSRPVRPLGQNIASQPRLYGNQPPPKKY